MTRSELLFKEASDVLVGGVDSPVRAFKSVGGTPVFVKSGTGAYVYTEDSAQLIDYVGAFGPHIMGHAHPAISQAIIDTLQLGMSFGAPSSLETHLAEAVISAFPSIEKIRFVNSGTEACMSALRVARGFTGRELVLKFNGCYHGHCDSLLVSAGSGNLTFGQLDSAGVPQSFVDHTAVSEFNDISALVEYFNAHGDRTAAVIIEPVVGNMGVVRPDELFLATLRSLCTRHGVVLIFDEVMTGFRVAPGGAQEIYGISPDLTCLGKIIGGGLPCGAFGGRAEIMNCLSPLGPVYQAGTLSGHPLVMSAGLAMLSLLSDPSVYTHLDVIGSALEDGILAISKRHDTPIQVNRVGSMISAFFTDTPVRDLPSAKRTDSALFSRLHAYLLAHGVMLPPSAYEAWFLSHSHTMDDIQFTLNTIDHFFATL